MPRPNRNRTIGAEDALANRIALERTARGWSYEELAKQMTHAGCPMQPASVFRIEKGEPRRRITVDELVALSRVWAIPLERLVTNASVERMVAAYKAAQ